MIKSSLFVVFRAKVLALRQDDYTSSSGGDSEEGDSDSKPQFQRRESEKELIPVKSGDEHLLGACRITASAGESFPAEEQRAMGVLEFHQKFLKQQEELARVCQSKFRLVSSQPSAGVAEKEGRSLKDDGHRGKSQAEKNRKRKVKREKKKALKKERLH